MRDEDHITPGNDQFESTQWSVVLAAKEQSSKDALEQLCQNYWYPVFAFIRRQGHNFAQAQDLTQSFFLTLLERDFLSGIQQDKGRFRHFLLASCRKHLLMQYRFTQAKKRGGGKREFSLDFLSAEQRYQLEPQEAITAEQLFEYRWAMTLIDNVHRRLGEECANAGKQAMFALLRDRLDGSNSESFKELGHQLGMSADAARVALNRMRNRFAHLLRQEIAQTVAEPGQVDEEIRNVFQALRLQS